MIAVCFSFVIFNAESICSPARLFDNSVNKAPRFGFGKQLLYIYSVRNQPLKLGFIKTLFIVNEITSTLKITSNRCKNLCHSPCNSTRVIFQLQVFAYAFFYPIQPCYSRPTLCGESVNLAFQLTLLHLYAVYRTVLLLFYLLDGLR